MISYWFPVIRAELEIHGKNPARALEVIEPATPYELANPDTWPGLGGPLYPIYLRGEARLACVKGLRQPGNFKS